MRPLPTPKQMAAADRAAIGTGTPASVLMDRAGRAVARAVIEIAGGRYGRRVAVVCGRGNNGGDGFVAARVLRRAGLAVTCLSVEDIGGVQGAAREHLDRLTDSGGRIVPFEAKRLRDADVIVDAIFGTGFHGRAGGEAGDAIEAINAARAPVVAVDIPSGVSGDTGRVEGPAVEAELTVAMGAEKTGTATGAGATKAGRVVVADIGIPVNDSCTFVTEPADVAGILPERRLDAHKRSGGAVALLVGSRGMTGAAVLAAKGAVRMGAGYATVGGTAATDEAISTQVAEVLSEVITDTETLGPQSLSRFTSILDRADALAIGPGIGQGEEQRALVEQVLGEVELPVVVDADGLNVLAKHTDALVARTNPTVITPHPGELARLLECSIEDIEGDRLGSARRAAKAFGCVVLLKGFRSVIAEPGDEAVVNPTGGPELATAGTGDVLTGALAALLAGGLEPFEAAWATAYVHGLAGELAAEHWGVAGVLASDVADELPHARAELE